MCLIVEIAMTIFGVVALFRGQVKVIGKNPVRGWPAYVIGALMAATLPLAFGTGLVIAVVIMASGGQVNMNDHLWILSLGDLAVVLGILLICSVLSVIYAKEPPPPGIPSSSGHSQFPSPDLGYPPQPSPPMDPNNPYAPPPGNWPPQK